MQYDIECSKCGYLTPLLYGEHGLNAVKEDYHNHMKAGLCGDPLRTFGVPVQYDNHYIREKDERLTALQRELYKE